MSSHIAPRLRSEDLSRDQIDADYQVSNVTDTKEQYNAGKSKITRGALSPYGLNYYIPLNREPRFPELQTYPFDEAPYKIPYLQERHLSLEEFRDIRKEYADFFAHWDPVFRKRNGKGALKSSEKLRMRYPDWNQNDCTERQYAYWCCYWNQSGWMV